MFDMITSIFHDKWSSLDETGIDGNAELTLGYIFQSCARKSSEHCPPLLVVRKPEKNSEDFLV